MPDNPIAYFNEDGEPYRATVLREVDGQRWVADTEHLIIDGRLTLIALKLSSYVPEQEDPAAPWWFVARSLNPSWPTLGTSVLRSLSVPDIDRAARRQIIATDDSIAKVRFGAAEPDSASARQANRLIDADKRAARPKRGRSDERPRYDDAHWQHVARVWHETIDLEPHPAPKMAAYFGVTPDTIRNWIRECRKRGLIPAHKENK